MIIVYNTPMGKRNAFNTNCIIKVIEDVTDDGPTLTIHLVGGAIAILKGHTLEDLQAWTK